MDRQNKVMDSERGNEIVNAAVERENSSGFCELIKSPLSNRVKSSYGIGFIEGAVWADEHNRKPTKEEVFEEGRKQAIEKACKWIMDNFPTSSGISAIMYADDLKRAMFGKNDMEPSNLENEL